MKLLVSLLSIGMLTGCASMEHWDDWNSRPTDGYWSITPSVDITRTADGKYYGSACAVSRIVNLCHAETSN